MDPIWIDISLFIGCLVDTRNNSIISLAFIASSFTGENLVFEVKCIQRSGTEAIKTQIQPSKPKREITNILNCKIQREHIVNRVSSYIPKVATQISNRNRTKNYMKTHKVKRHRNCGTKKQATENQNTTTALERSVMNYWGGGGLNMFYAANLALSF